MRSKKEQNRSASEQIDNTGRPASERTRSLPERTQRSRTARHPQNDNLDLFLKTKVSPPLASANLVFRPRLMERLTEGLQHNLVLVSAPAGSGKTTLLGQWASRCPAPIAWVSLDAADNDPVRFSASIIAAIQTQRPGFAGAALAMLRSTKIPTVESVVTLLVNEIAASPDELVLILDDYHTIQHDAIHQGIALLLEHPAPNLHLVIATRTDPPIPLARLRAKGQVVEFKVTDLNFTLAETDSFLNQTMHLGLTTDDVTTLENRTEGWIVGLMTAALSIREHGDIHKFAATFSGDNWRIVDYLIEEVVRRQSESIQTFLMRTAVLDRLNGPLTEAVAGLAEGEGQAILKHLERANLFTVPLDSARSWYRYHPLFAECLRTRLRLLHPHEEEMLHLAASVWYKSKGIADSAMKHALAAHEFELASDIIETYAEGMFIQSEVATLREWLKSLPDVVVRSRPFLSIWFAHALLASGQVDAAEARVLDTIQWLEAEKNKPDTAPEIARAERMRNHTLALRAAIAATRRDAQLTIELSRQALDHSFGQDDYFLHGRLLHNLGSAYLWNGDVVKAEEMLSEALAESELPGNPFTSVLASCQLAGIQVARGRLHAASKTYLRAIQLASDPSGSVQPIAGRAYLGLALLHFEWDNLDAANQWASDGMELVRQSGMMDILLQGYRIRARLAQVSGDFAEAAEILHEAEHLAHANRLRQEQSRIAYYQARLCLAQGDIRSASRWAETSGLSVHDEPSFLRESGHLTLARVLIAQERYGEAADLLERLLRSAEATGRADSAIKILTLLAPAVEKSRSVDEAAAMLGRALRLAEGENYRRTFMDAGRPILDLLTRLSRTEQDNPSQTAILTYAQKLLGGAVPDNKRLAENILLAPTPPGSGLLSKREEEVLRLIAAGWSRPQIAAGLVISPNTVRTHTKTIYGKLEAHNRAEMLAKARDLGLLTG